MMVFQDMALKAPMVNQELQVFPATLGLKAPLEPLETQDCQDLRVKKVGCSHHQFSLCWFYEDRTNPGALQVLVALREMLEDQGQLDKLELLEHLEGKEREGSMDKMELQGVRVRKE